MPKRKSVKVKAKAKAKVSRAPKTIARNSLAENIITFKSKKK